MKMNQIVYVVMNSESATICGVYNDMEDAVAVATTGWVNAPEVTITPILVDARPVSDNTNCECVSDLQDEVASLLEWVEEEGEYVYDLEEEDKGEEYDEDEDEDEDNDNTLRAAIDIVISALRDTLDDLES